MNDPQKAIATQLENIEKRTGKSLAELKALVRGCGLAKHVQIRDMLKGSLGLGHGDANMLTHVALAPDEEAPASADQALDEIYAGPKQVLRPIHDRAMECMLGFGAFEIAPKKTYLSLRRKKQFAMVGPATNTRVEVGLNLKDATATSRLVEMPAKSMCKFKVKLEDVAQVDAELIGWLRQAYDEAG